MTGLATLLALGLLLAASLGVWTTLRTLTRPPRRTYSWALARARPSDPSELATPRPFRAWSFTSRGLALPAWDLDGDNPDGPLLVITHGWGDSRYTMLDRADALARLASRVIAWDLPGHGEAPGRCHLGTDEVEDLGALLQAACKDPGPPVVLYGFSLGAGVSLARAARAPVAAVIAEAPYRLAQTPARNVLIAAGLPYRWNLPAALGLLNWRWGGGRLRPEAFDRATLASRVECPVLVVHGDQDEICPVEDGRAIAAAAPSGEFVAIPGGQHLSLWATPATRAAVLGAIEGFLRRRGLLGRP